jgi:hypothetical protein
MSRKLQFDVEHNKLKALSEERLGSQAIEKAWMCQFSVAIRNDGG